MDKRAARLAAGLEDVRVHDRVAKLRFPTPAACGRTPLMAEGLSNHAIAERLVVTERAVEKHVTGIFAKLRLPQTGDTHRRVLAVLAYMRA